VARKAATRLVAPMAGMVASATSTTASLGARTALNPAAAWPFPTGSRP
jgi:hypothetical protein